MKKIIKILLFSLMLISGFILASCGEKKEELTGLHKEFDIIFNGIKDEVLSEFEKNKEAIEKEAKNSSNSEDEVKFKLNSLEIMLEALKSSTYEIENINDMRDKAELQIKVKAVDFIQLSEEIVEKLKDKNNKSEEAAMMNMIEEMLKRVKKKNTPTIEQEITIQMFKESDKWGIDDSTKNSLMTRMMGVQKGSIFNW